MPSNQSDPDSTPGNDILAEDDQDDETVVPMGSIYIAKATIGGDGSFGFDTDRDGDSDADFTITTSAGNGEDLTALKDIAPGLYTITELVPDGWALTDSYCLDRTEDFGRSIDPTVVVDLQPGQIMQCYFINTKLGSITVEKSSIGGAGTFNFDSDVDGSDVDGLLDFAVTTSNTTRRGTRTYTDLVPGNYTLRELLPSGWSLTDLTCSGDTDDDSEISLGNRTAVVHLDAGEEITCTFENTKHGRITLVKQLTDADGLDRDFAFSSSTLGNNSFTLTTNDGSANRIFADLLPDTYDISELVPSGWQLTNISCTGATNSEIAIGDDIDFDAGDDEVVIGLAAGESLTCTFTNDPLPTATVTKTAATLTLVEPGDDVEFTAVIRNTSPTEPLFLTALVDNPGNIDLAQVCPLPTEPLAPAGEIGDSFTCTFTRSVTGDPGEYTDTVTATLRDDEGNTITPSDSATVTLFDVGPAASVTKVASPTTRPEPGGLFTFTVTVRNLSIAEDLRLTTLVDAPFGDITSVQGAITETDCSVPRTIVAEGIYQCAFTVNLQGPPDDYDDTVTATLMDDDDNEISRSGDATVTITDLPSAMRVVKTATPTALPEPGDDVTFMIDIVNISAVDTITITSINDDIYGDVCGTLLNVVIPPNETASCEFTERVEGNAGDRHTNIVTVNAIDDDDTQLEEN